MIVIAALVAVLILLNKQKASDSSCATYGKPGVYFTWEELTATNSGKPNNPNGPDCTNLKRLVTNILDPLRELTGSPIYISSGFRSFQTNRAVGGVANSTHLHGKGADIYSNKYNPGELKALILQYGIPHGELITYPTHLHVSL